MIDDFAGAYERLDVTFELTQPTNAPIEANEDEAPIRVFVVEVKRRSAAEAAIGSSKNLSDGRGAEETCFGPIVVVLAVEPASAWTWVNDTLRKPTAAATMPRITRWPVRARPVLFTLGVNEQQTMANRAGRTISQTEVNRRGVAALREYHNDFVRDVDPFSGSTVEAALARLAELVEVLSPFKMDDESVVLLKPRIESPSTMNTGTALFVAVATMAWYSELKIIAWTTIHTFTDARNWSSFCCLSFLLSGNIATGPRTSTSSS
jgi:hypothetical protein